MIILSNYRNCDTDFPKGFVQGIILTSVSQPNDSSLPKRYVQARSNLTQNSNIIISPNDKSGGVVIMHKHRYVDKINSLLEDTNIYKISHLITINKDITSFNNLLKKTCQPPPKKKLGLPSLNTTLQSSYGLPKIHKPNISLRPIISSIGRNSHKMARVIPKISPLLGKISPSHVINCRDLIKSRT